MEKEQELQALLDQVVRQGGILSVSARSTYGMANSWFMHRRAWRTGNGASPFARDTICRVFSMSKPITAFAVMKLWEDGKLDRPPRWQLICRSSGMPSIRT